MVQRKFLSFTGFILHTLQHLPRDYSPVYNAINIETLAKRKLDLNSWMVYYLEKLILHSSWV